MANDDHPLRRVAKRPDHWMQKAGEQMKKKGTVGKFTAIANRRGESVQEAASDLYNAPGKEGQEARYAYIAGHGHGK